MLRNSPVLPPCHQVGVFHQVAIDILHVITAMRHYQANGDKEHLENNAHAYTHMVQEQFNHSAKATCHARKLLVMNLTGN